MLLEIILYLNFRSEQFFFYDFKILICLAYWFYFSIGENIKSLIDRPEGLYCFRLQKDRVYYVSEKTMKIAATIPRHNLISLGTCFGKFTKSGKFRLHVTALDFLAPYAPVSNFTLAKNPYCNLFMLYFKN